MRVLKKNIIFHKNGKKQLHTRQDLARCVHSFNFAVKYESDRVWAPRCHSTRELFSSREYASD